MSGSKFFILCIVSKSGPLVVTQEHMDYIIDRLRRQAGTNPQVQFHWEGVRMSIHGNFAVMYRGDFELARNTFIAVKAELEQYMWARRVEQVVERAKDPKHPLNLYSNSPSVPFHLQNEPCVTAPNQACW